MSIGGWADCDVVLVASSSLHFVFVHVVLLLTGSESFASQGFLVALFDLDVAALQLQCPRESAAWSHTREILGRVDGEHVTQDFCEYR